MQREVLCNMEKQQLLQKIYDQMEVFKKNSSSCGRRQYLSSAAILCEYDKRLSEIFNSDEDIDMSELEEISRGVDNVLQNLGMVSST